MWRHRKTKHANFNTDDNINTNIDPNTNQNEPVVFKCKKCNKESSSKYNLARHEKKYCKKI
jgi:hypothetical protein